MRRYTFYFLFILLFSFTGCATRFSVPAEPRPVPKCLFPSCIRLALVLGGGGARGMAHVGVLEEFEKAGIPIDVIVGCSAGSVVGALYADCPNAGTVKSLLNPLKKWDILDLDFSRCRYGLVQGRSFTRFLEKNLCAHSFEKLRIPLCIAATDLLEGKMVCLNSGPLIPAVHASSAVPFVFAPVQLHDRLLVDGGVTDPVPVCIAKKLHAEIIVAVDLSELLPKTCPSNLFGVAKRSAEIKFLLQSESCVDGADVVIRPELGGVGLFDDRNNEHVYEAGRKAAREAIPKIIDLLEQKGFWYTTCFANE
ncbi:MAG: patatin-like phospholipase family protein [Candidatus Protochlamydia sp.]|nr:patatin-like phospholipase family protein [Candidatus Protochlamydia sp.]